MNRTICKALCLFAIGGLGPGCGSSPQAPTTPGQPVAVGANSRIKFKPEYKKLLGEEGKEELQAEPNQEAAAGRPLNIWPITPTAQDGNACDA